MTETQKLAQQVVTLTAALNEARLWNNADIRGLANISPNLEMLKARRAVIADALRASKG